MAFINLSELAGRAIGQVETRLPADKAAEGITKISEGTLRIIGTYRHLGITDPIEKQVLAASFSRHLIENVLQEMHGRVQTSLRRLNLPEHDILGSRVVPSSPDEKGYMQKLLDQLGNEALAEKLGGNTAELEVLDNAAKVSADYLFANLPSIKDQVKQHASNAAEASRSEEEEAREVIAKTLGHLAEIPNLLIRHYKEYRALLIPLQQELQHARMANDSHNKVA